MLNKIFAGEVHRVMSLRNPLQKMSKSDNQPLSTINLSDSPDLIVKKIQKAVTDCEGRITYDPQSRPGVANLVSMYAALAGMSHEDVCKSFETKQTVDLKKSLGELTVESLAPIRVKMEALEHDSFYMDSVLVGGAERARALAEENLVQIKKKMGIL